MRYRRIVGRGLAASGNDHQRPAEIWVATYNGTEPGLGEHPAERNGELANDVEPLARAAHAWCKPPCEGPMYHRGRGAVLAT